MSHNHEVCAQRVTKKKNTENHKTGKTENGSIRKQNMIKNKSKCVLFGKWHKF